MKKTMVCALTGHRDLPPEFDRAVLSERLALLIEGGCDSFLCGMAPGFDLEALEELVFFRKKGKTLYLEACIPYRDQQRRYLQAEKERYERLLAQCDRKTVLYENYCNGCFLSRDRYMVDCADVVLAYLVRKSGGTAYTVNYALKKGVTVLYV